MDVPAPMTPSPLGGRYSAEQYLRLVDEGVLGPDDRVELLCGVVVGMAPQNSPHASGVMRATYAIMRAIGDRALVRTQCTFVAAVDSVPEPDLAIVPGRLADYDHAHPRAALLIVEVADTSLAQDRLTKAPIYAGADIPDYWIVDIHGQRVEVHRDPDRTTRRYRTRTLARPGDRLVLAALPDASVAVDDLLPRPAPHGAAG